ncbi:MAG: hypothetical protein AAFZ89_02060 [Bacteroidota bacterium]
MTKRIILCFLAFPIFVSCYEPERNCDAFKTGEFSFEYEVDGVKKSGTFTRTDAYSVEFYEGKVDSASVRWINDCEFVLKPLDNRGAIHYKIIKTTADSYTFEYKRAVKSTKDKLIVKRGTAIKTN